MHPLDETRFWLQVNEDSKRVVYCAEGDAERVRGVFEQYGMARTHEVRVSPLVEMGKVVFMDYNAIEASMKAALQKQRHNGSSDL